MKSVARDQPAKPLRPREQSRHDLAPLVAGQCSAVMLLAPFLRSGARSSRSHTLHQGAGPASRNRTPFRRLVAPAVRLGSFPASVARRASIRAARRSPPVTSAFLAGTCQATPKRIDRTSAAIALNERRISSAGGNFVAAHVAGAQGVAQLGKALRKIVVPA